MAWYFPNPREPDCPDEDTFWPLISGFQQVCSRLGGLKQASLVTNIKDRLMIHAQHRQDDELSGGDDVEDPEVDGEWGIYFAASGYRSPWYVGTSVHAYVLKCETRAQPPDDVFAEDLAVTRLTFNTRNWFPDNATVAHLSQRLVGRDGVPHLDVIWVDLWESVERPFLEQRWRREHGQA
jgi:hypothetical protein